MSLTQYNKLVCENTPDKIKITLHYKKKGATEQDSKLSLFKVKDHYVLMEFIKPVEIFQTFKEFENYLRRKYGEIPMELGR